MQGYILNYIYKYRRILTCSQEGEQHKLVVINKLSDIAFKKYGEEPSTQYLSLLYECLHDRYIKPDDIQILLEYDQEHVSIGCGDLLDDTAQKQVLEQLYKESAQIDINRVLATITPRERDVVESYYGLNNKKARDLYEIGDER